MVNNIKSIKTIVLLGLLLLSSCEKLVTWDEFALQKTLYDGSQLRTEGYYYQLDKDGKYHRLCCFYRNGILLGLGGDFSSEVEMDAYINREFISDHRYAEIKNSWGLFVVNDQTIKFEHYYPSDDINKRSYIREGTILNDTTFHITVSYRSDGSERREKDELYHFRAFSPKPDSTNIFIK